MHPKTSDCVQYFLELGHSGLCQHPPSESYTPCIDIHFYVLLMNFHYIHIMIFQDKVISLMMKSFPLAICDLSSVALCSMEPLEHSSQGPCSMEPLEGPDKFIFLLFSRFKPLNNECVLKCMEDQCRSSLRS